MTISVEQLASLANDRTLSTAFEQAWYDRTGVNPVQCALKIVKFKREKLRHRISIINAGVVFVGSVLATVALGMHLSLVTITSATFADILNSLATVASFIIAIISGLFMVGISEDLPETKYDALTAFCDDLAVFFRNDPIDKWGCTARANLEQLREHAFKTLVGKAMVVLRAKELIDSAEGDQEHVDVALQHGQRLSEFAMTYDALNRIGMASGGFDPAFKAAAKQIAQAEK